MSPPRSKPANRIASPRMVVNSAADALSTSTLTICRGVISPRGLTQSAAAVSDEIRRPVIGSKVAIRGGIAASVSGGEEELAGKPGWRREATSVLRAIQDFESGKRQPIPATLAAIRTVLEAAGVQ